MYSNKKSLDVLSLPGSGLDFLFFLLIFCSEYCYGESLFTEKFNRDIEEIGRGNQYATSLPLKHGSQYSGWTKQGNMPVHFVLQGGDDWALMLFSNSPGENTLTLNKPFYANEKGIAYTITVLTFVKMAILKRLFGILSKK